MKPDEIKLKVAEMELKFYRELCSIFTLPDPSVAGYTDMASVRNRVKQMKKAVDKFIMENDEE